MNRTYYLELNLSEDEEGAIEWLAKKAEQLPEDVLPDIVIKYKSGFYSLTRMQKLTDHIPTKP